MTGKPGKPQSGEARKPLTEQQERPTPLGRTPQIRIDGDAKAKQQQSPKKPETAQSTGPRKADR